MAIGKAIMQSKVLNRNVMVVPLLVVRLATKVMELVTVGLGILEIVELVMRVISGDGNSCIRHDEDICIQYQQK